MKKILVGLDGSDGSFKAFAEGLAFAKVFNAAIETISVEEIPHFAETIGEIVDEKKTEDTKFGSAIRMVREIARKNDVSIHSHVVIGHEVKSIIEFVLEHKFDLLVIGFMGHSALYDRVMGGTCQGLVRLAPCSVFVVK